MEACYLCKYCKSVSGKETWNFTTSQVYEGIEILIQDAHEKAKDPCCISVHICPICRKQSVIFSIVKVYL